VRVRQFDEMQSLHFSLEVNFRLRSRFELENVWFAATRAAELADYFTTLELCLDDAICTTNFTNASKFFIVTIM